MANDREKAIAEAVRRGLITIERARELLGVEGQEPQRETTLQEDLQTLADETGLTGAAEALAQGAFFGFYDEARPYLQQNPLFRGNVRPEEMGATPEQITQQTRQRMAQFAEDRPVTSTVAELAGGIGTGGAATLFPQIVSRSASRALPSTARQIGQMAAEGAFGGAIAGAGYADDESRLEGAAGGAALGGAGGAALGGALRGAGRLLSRGADDAARVADDVAPIPVEPDEIVPPSADAPMMTAGEISNIMQAADDAPRRGPMGDPVGAGRRMGENVFNQINDAIDRVFPVEGRANARMSEALMLDDINAEQLAQRVQQFEAREGVRPTLLQLGGENVEALGRAVGGEVGEGRSIIEQFRNRVLDGQTAQVQRIAQRSLTDSPIDYFQDIDRIEAQMRRQASPLYEAAHAERVVVPREIKALVQRPSGKRGLRRAHTLLREEGYNPSGFGLIMDEGKLALDDEVSVRTLDAIKRGFDDLIESRRDPVTNRLKLDEFGRAINQTARRYLREVDKLSPVYAEARQAYAGPARLRSALRDGRDLLRRTATRPQDIRERMGRMSESEREFYRAGLMRGLIDQMQDAVTDTNRIRKLVRSEGLRNKLSAVFDDSKVAKAFIEDLQQAETLASRVQRISPTTGSLTDVRGADRRAFSNINDARSALSKVVEDAYDRFRQQRNQRNQQIINRDIATILTQPLDDDLLAQLAQRIDGGK